MASRKNGTLYIGVTNDIARRAYEHREGLIPGFTKRYDVKLLVLMESFDDTEPPFSEKRASRNGREHGKLL